jgi:DNA-directed RNA polymerase subunit RPC12/RpoP
MKKTKKLKKALRIVAQDAKIEYGVCPYCHHAAPLLFLYKNFYRCASCGEESEQYINGVIKYVPITSSTRIALMTETNE